MNRLITRPLLALSASGLALAVVAAPVKASAAELDEDVVAAQLCGADAVFVDADVAEDDAGVSATVLVYETAQPGDAPATVCTFAIVSSDEDDARLDGSYSLRVGDSQASGAVLRDGGATLPVRSTTGQSPAAVFAASGRQTTIDVTKASSSTRKAARKKLAAATAKAKKTYARAGRTAAAKKTMKRKISAASKRYAAAVAPRTRTTTVPYRLDLTLPLDATDDLP